MGIFLSFSLSLWFAVYFAAAAASTGTTFFEYMTGMTFKEYLNKTTKSKHSTQGQSHEELQKPVDSPSEAQSLLRATRLKSS
jgi:hypothetical protein